ncbi:hypothetical protein M422DRAFT_272213 [Sphaerobolus stellatus SS14]|uniref:Uncharacterized protein n=1 Tax=Sphaerobolus stellatus (strain SS14) TaxID=990650 RepID=A0A0C9TXZ1_SPHS4|nr:hypothetical protein M422DRAFT_272213 [Sphaerobolus stellatus SS14]
MKEWVAEYTKLGKDQKDVLLKAMKTDIDSLIMKGTEIVSKLKEKGNLNGGRDGVGSSLIDVTKCPESSLSKWGVAPFVGGERSHIVKFVKDLGGEVLMHMKNLADNMQMGGNVDLKLYFDLLKYLEAVIRTMLFSSKKRLFNFEGHKSHTHILTYKTAEIFGDILAYIDHSFGSGSVDGLLVEEWKKFLSLLVAEWGTPFGAPIIQGERPDGFG